MANRPSSTPPRPVYWKGSILRAEDLQRIVDMLIKRLEGGKGISVKSFGKNLVIERNDL